MIKKLFFGVTLTLLSCSFITLTHAQEAPCTQATPGNVIISLNQNTSYDQSNAQGVKNVDFIKFDIKNIGSQPICNLNGLQIGSQKNLENYIENVRIWDTQEISVATIPSFVSNGNYYYAWTQGLNQPLLPSATKTFRIIGDIKANAIVNDPFKVGVWGVNFDFPGAMTSGIPLSGAVITVTSALSEMNFSVSATPSLITNTSGTSVLKWDVTNAPANAAIQIGISGDTLNAGGDITLPYRNIVGNHLLDGSTRTIILSNPDQPTFPSHGTINFTPQYYAGYLPILGPINFTIIDSNTGAILAQKSVPLRIVGTVTAIDTTPRIAYWYGKVNQHVDTNGNWMSDPDGVSGANIDKLSYCKKWYPNTTSVSENYKSESMVWYARGNVNPLESQRMSDSCIQGAIPTGRFLKVISPNGGENFKTGQKMKISWSSSGYGTTSVVAIDLVTLSEDGSGTNTFLMSSTGLKNDGEETLVIPTNMPDGTSYGIYMSIYDPLSSLYQSDNSDRPFTIMKSIKQPPVAFTCDIASFTAYPATVTPGSVADLSWNTNCSNVSIQGLDAFPWKNFGAVGHTDTRVDATTTYALHGTNDAGCLGTNFSTTSGQKCNYTYAYTAVTMSGGTGTTLPAGCTSANGYSVTTGLPCNTGMSLPAGCTSTLGYSTTTGLPCSSALFPVGCTSTTGYSPITGQPCNWTTSTLGYPEGCSATIGYSVITGASCASTTKKSYPLFTRSLKVGTTGEDVKALQAKLMTEGVYTGPTNGNYGPLTQEAVKKFQVKYNISAVGVVGPQTLEVLNN